MKNVIVLNTSLVTLKVDIIVNAANKSLLGGGGIDGVIHRNAGKELLLECKKLNGCETGEAKMTGAYNLPCDRIIHTVGPVYVDGKHNEEVLLCNAYKNSIALANKYRIENNLDNVTIAFPCISTGVYHYPKMEACKVAVNSVKNSINDDITVIFVCFDEENYKYYVKEVYNIDIV